MIFQSPAAAQLFRSTLKNHQIWQKMKKCLVPIVFKNLFLHGTGRYPKAGFWVPIPPLATTGTIYKHLSLQHFFSFLEHCALTPFVNLTNLIHILNTLLHA